MKHFIKSHFNLQRIRFERASIEFGVSPLISCILGFIVFVGLSIALLMRGNQEQWLYILLPIIIIYLLSDTDRIKFYKQTYSKKTFLQVRFFENMLVSIPFIICLISFKAIIPAVVLFLILSTSIFINPNVTSLIALPTPYYKYPFEFTAGFRLSWPILIIHYIIYINAVAVSNSYLGTFTLISTALCSTLYYQFQEASFFIWIYNLDSKNFIFYKLKIALSYTLLTCLPLLITSIIVWPYMTHWILLLLFFALLFISSIITAKYVMYPNIFNLPLALLLSIGFVIPPLLLFIYPYLYRRASRNLNSILS